MFNFFHSKRYLALSCGLNFANSCDITTTTSIANIIIKITMSLRFIEIINA